MKDEILEFINRRFPIDCHWTDGNCYWFAKILCDRFPDLTIDYEVIKGHFIAHDQANNIFYDWNGVYVPDFTVYNLDELRKDSLWYNRIVRDCIN